MDINIAPTHNKILNVTLVADIAGWLWYTMINNINIVDTTMSMIDVV